MTQKEQLRIMVKQMIAEAVSHRIAQIDEAGDIAANEAKMTRIEQEATKAKKVMELMEKVNLSHYLGEKLYAKVMEEMDKSIQEYEGARLELEEKMSGGKDVDKKGKKKGGKPAKKADKADKDDESKEEVLETDSIKIDEQEQELTLNELKPGDRVQVKSLNKVGSIHDLADAGKKTARVAFGAFDTNPQEFPLSDLEKLSDKQVSNR